ncbi:tetratricopeptide repeat protein [Ruegeria sp. HKCCC2117]|uniref:tetratricopeptide repeat protein n=1 Tax=Ruegeria sp. HKCCC2117 TaxID=2682992 RepID=UPI001487618E|nr:hypothetical protein [Ruegeria sp. HKCCC2117]
MLTKSVKAADVVTSRGLHSESGRDPIPKNLTDPEIRQALDAILNSPEFEGAERLQSFLRYVVETLLAGHGDNIRAKSIAEDVYGRSLGGRGDPMAVVRVDAGRMRRRLANYYSNSGKDECLRIHVDPGGYVPRFEVISANHENGTPWTRRNWLRSVALMGVLLLCATGLYLQFNPQQSTSVSDPSEAARKQQAVREALFSTNPTKLQAMNLADEARPLMFPVLDRARLQAVSGMFERAIALDNSYFGGYAGSAQSLGILAITTPTGAEKRDFLVQAEAYADKAVELAPGEGWSHSALALVSFAKRDFEATMAHSNRAIRLAPDDIHVINFDALFALFGGDFERATRSAKRAQNYDTTNRRFPYRSVLASSNFHLGDYQGCVDQFNRSIRLGDPVSAISIGYLAAAYQRLGEHDRAKATILLLDEAWPNYPLSALLRALFADPSHAEDIISALNEI